LVCHVGQFAADDPEKSNSVNVGFLEHGFGSKTAPDELYLCHKFLRESGESMAETD